MAKRKPLLFDNTEITKSLRASAGQGVDAFFAPQAVPSPIDKPNDDKPKSKKAVNVKKSVNHSLTRLITPRKKKKEVKLKASNITNNNVSKQSSNIAILQFDDADIEELREAAYKAQTYRFTETEVERIKDTAHSLSKEIRRHSRVTQVDILRIALKLFDNALAINKTELIKILERMK